MAVNSVELAVVALHGKMEQAPYGQMKTSGEQQDGTDKPLLVRG